MSGNGFKFNPPAGIKAAEEIRYPVYGEEGIREMLFVIEGGVVPTTIGATFTCRVVGIKREITER